MPRLVPLARQPRQAGLFDNDMAGRLSEGLVGRQNGLAGSAGTALTLPFARLPVGLTCQRVPSSMSLRQGDTAAMRLAEVGAAMRQPPLA